MTNEEFNKADTTKQVSHCYLDIKVSDEKVGRMVIEVRKDIVPRTAENFRSLCTGEKGLGLQGKPLHYKNTIFNRVVPQFMVQAGDIISNDGSGGESIYGLTFNDENFIIEHDCEGVVGMANNGPNSNSSQFYITTSPCSHLDGRNVAFGKVIKGLNIIKDFDFLQRSNDIPEQKCEIVDCGELKPGELWNYWERDETEDVYPPYPDDWECDENKIDIESVVTKIKNSGNYYFKHSDYQLSERKYKKALRYINWYINANKECNSSKVFSIKINTLLNMATVKLKRQKYAAVISICTDVINIDPKVAKAYYKRAQAYMGLKDYDNALASFKIALQIYPNNKMIYVEFQNARNKKIKYMEKEKEIFAKMFQ